MFLIVGYLTSGNIDIEVRANDRFATSWCFGCIVDGYVVKHGGGVSQVEKPKAGADDKELIIRGDRRKSVIERTRVKCARDG